MFGHLVWQYMYGINIHNIYLPCLLCGNLYRSSLPGRYLTQTIDWTLWWYTPLSAIGNHLVLKSMMTGLLCIDECGPYARNVGTWGVIYGLVWCPSLQVYMSGRYVFTSLHRIWYWYTFQSPWTLIPVLVADLGDTVEWVHIAQGTLDRTITFNLHESPLRAELVNFEVGMSTTITLMPRGNNGKLAVWYVPILLIWIGLS